MVIDVVDLCLEAKLVKNLLPSVSNVEIHEH